MARRAQAICAPFTTTARSPAAVCLHWPVTSSLTRWPPGRPKDDLAPPGGGSGDFSEPGALLSSRPSSLLLRKLSTVQGPAVGGGANRVCGLLSLKSMVPGTPSVSPCQVSVSAV
ncbi:MAG: hypothetical protein COW48_04815 [Hydrogenophilales bacterium CG17_big_fil_post_rev_8_21_14_2_50_63_12]|nr:MAG: hypothetical protein COW48_04815 [Hydrogenophilales bacterium CG17_big_fil_post_rev_8_21_14_2_50_63_12]